MESSQIFNKNLPSNDELIECKSLLQTAHLYTLKGWPVFPCCEHGAKMKAPYTTHGFKDATTNPAQILKWWNRNPNALIGLPTGPDTGLIIIDCDLRENGDGIFNFQKLISIQDLNTLESTPTVNTPSGGIHYYYLQPIIETRLKSRLTNFVDIKSKGGYVIAPGSVLPNGKRYKWDESKNKTNSQLRYPSSDLLKLLKRPTRQTKIIQNNQAKSHSQVQSALNCIPSIDYEIWLKVGMALKTDFGDTGFHIWDNWSKKSPEKYDPKNQQKTWQSFKHEGVNIETIFYLAREHGCDLSELAKKKQKEASKKTSFNTNPIEKQTNTELVSTRASDIQPRPIHWLWKDKIPLRAYSLIAGQGGKAKSQIAISLAATVSNGGLFPDKELCPQGQVFIISAEDTKQEIIVPRLIAADANLQNIHILDAVNSRNEQGQIIKQPTFNFENDIPALHEKISKLSNVKLIIIDPIMSFMGKVNTHNLSETRAALAPIADLAEKHDLSILLIHHTNKASTTNSYGRVSGSTGFLDAARAAYVVGNCPDQKDINVLAPLKANWGTDTTSFKYHVLQNKFDHEGDLIVTSHVEWLGECNYTANQILNTEKNSDNQSTIEAAEQFLKNELMFGSKPTKHIIKKAEENGFSESTVRRAKEKLNIKSSRKGGSDGQWLWNLSK